ncbi:hypothetical protein KQX54_004994 [Cotesia glomerata]|uniref:DNA helicase n=1 Tax=Cotesia glomerata TaxID=32391 RepID=A0AAV7J1M9_COTGL|nr:hypothetical protein KQX54_004994 [Cotesia glomerata]
MSFLSHKLIPNVASSCLNLNSDNYDKQSDENVSFLVPQTQENILAEVLLPQLIPNVELQSSSESVINDVNPLQSNGRKKRRKRVNYTIRKRQLRQATLNYTHRNPDVHRKATKKYASNNPHVSRAATTKYNEKRLQIKLMSWTLKALSGLSYEPSIDYQNDKIVNLGHRLPCSWCRALKWKDEAEGMCCSGEVDGRISIPDNLGDIVDDLTTLTDKIYPDINKIGVNYSSWLKERAILTPTNDSANRLTTFFWKSYQLIK